MCGHELSMCQAQVYGAWTLKTHNNTEGLVISESVDYKLISWYYCCICNERFAYKITWLAHLN